MMNVLFIFNKTFLVLNFSLFENNTHYMWIISFVEVISSLLLEVENEETFRHNTKWWKTRLENQKYLKEATKS